MKIKRLALVSMLIGLIALLSGCVKADFHVTVNKNGSADLDYKIGLNAQLAGLMSQNGDPIEQMKTGLQQKGFAVTQYRDGEYIGVQAKKHQDTIKDIGNSLPNQGMLAQGQTNNTDQQSFTEDKGLFFTTYKYNGSLDMSSLKADANDTMGIQQMMLKQIDLKFTLTLPVEAESQNASRVLSDKKTYQWDLIPGTKGDISLQAKVPNVTNITIAAALIIIILISVIVAILKSRRKGKLQVLPPSDEQPLLPLE